LGLSNPVRAALPALVERAVAEAAALGRPFTKRPRARVPPALLGDSHAHRLLGL
jgi:hypothetical protein